MTQTQKDAAQAAVLPWCKYINATPALISILYDIDLMPEQIVLMVNANRMAAFCLLFQKLTAEQVTSLFTQENPTDAG